MYTCHDLPKVLLTFIVLKKYSNLKWKQYWCWRYVYWSLPYSSQPVISRKTIGFIFKSYLWIQLCMNGNVIWITNHVTAQLLKPWTFTVWNIAQGGMQQITWKNNHLQTKLHVICICDINDIFYVLAHFDNHLTAWKLFPN